MQARESLACMALLGAVLGCSGNSKSGEGGHDIDMAPSTATDGSDGATQHGHDAADAGDTAHDQDGSAPGDGEADAGSAPCGGDCGPGQSCNEATSTCEPAPSGCDCEAGSHCDESTSTCVPGCEHDSDCASGETCDLATSTCAAKPTCDTTHLPSLALSKVFVNQAVEIPLYDQGATVPASARPAPVVQNRAALFRVMVTPTAGYMPTNVVAELTLDNGGTKTALQSSAMVTSASVEDTLEGTINIKVDAARIGPDTKYAVALTTTECAKTAMDGRFASTGALSALAAEKTGRVKVVLVPYERAPYKLNTSAEALQAIKEGVFAYYPTEGIDIEVHAPIAVTNPSTDLQRLLSHIRSLRAQDAPSDDAYYFGMFTAASTFRDFCGNGCVAGIASLNQYGEFGSPEERYGVGIGYLSDVMTTSMGKPTTEKDITVNTMAHELGHAHGRQHTPCGNPAGIDRNFPNNTAAIDTYGYNLITGAYAKPKTHTDIMAYCEPNWIHPYTYSALATRIQGVNGNQRVIQSGIAVAYAQLVLEHDGRYVWGDELSLRGQPAGTPETARAYDVSDKLVDGAVPISVAELADFAGVLVTLPALVPAWASLEIAGRRIPIEHSEL